MRIHTDKLTGRDLYQAAGKAGADLDYAHHGSRSREHAFDVHLTGNSRRRPNRSHGEDEYAATWDQWGVFLGELFRRDPELTIPRAYADADAFHRLTDGRFDEPGMPDDAHGDHRFEWAGTPREQECTQCSAVQRW